MLADGFSVGGSVMLYAKRALLDFAATTITICSTGISPLRTGS